PARPWVGGMRIKGFSFGGVGAGEGSPPRPGRSGGAGLEEFLQLAGVDKGAEVVGLEGADLGGPEDLVGVEEVAGAEVALGGAEGNLRGLEHLFLSTSGSFPVRLVLAYLGIARKSSPGGRSTSRRGRRTPRCRSRGSRRARGGSAEGRCRRSRNRSARRPPQGRSRPPRRRSPL